MFIVKSNRPDTKALDGTFVTKRPDYCVVESEDGKLQIVTPGELSEGPLERLTIESTRPHISVHNGKEVRVVRAIKPVDNGYSANVGQVVVAPRDGSAQLTVQIAELVSEFEGAEGVVHSKRPELKDHKGESVKVVRSVMPGDDAYQINGPHQYWVIGKDKKEYVVEASELKMSEIKPEAKPAVATDTVPAGALPAASKPLFTPDPVPAQ
jgi:hypothetical protein